LAVSPDGLLIATGTDDGTVHTWRASDGVQVAQLAGHAQAITSLTFSADSTMLTTGSTDGTVRTWSVDGSEFSELLTIPSTTGAVTELSLDATGTQLAMATEAGFPAILNANPGHTKLVRALAYADGMIATASLDGDAWLWDSDGRVLAQLEDHTEGLWDVAFSDDGRFVATASSDRTVKVWEAETGLLVRTISGHGDRVFGVRFSPEGDRLATTSGDGLVRLWDLGTGGDLSEGDELTVLSGHSAPVNAVAFTSDGELMATGSDDLTAILWDRDGNQIETLEGHEDSIITLAFSPDGQHLATGGFDNTVRIWDVDSGDVHIVGSPFLGTVYEVAWNSDGTHLSVATADPGTAVQVLDVEGLLDGTERSARTELRIPHSSPVYALSYAGDDWLAMAGSGGLLVVNPLDLNELEGLAASRITRPLRSDECLRYDIDDCDTQQERAP
jgi:WD40 repeat protein